MEEPDPEPYQQAFEIASGTLIQPFSPEVLLLFAGLALLLVVSALISGSEVAYFSLTPSQLKELRSENTPANLKVMALLGKPKKLLATILIANNFVNVSIIIISTIITARLFYLESSPLLAFLLQAVVVTATILIFGEIIPKMLASHYSLQYAGMVSGFVGGLSFMFSPLSFILVNSTSFIDKRIKRKGHDVSISELGEAIEITAGKTSPEEERKILKGIVKFSDTEVREVMKARIDVTSVEVNTPFEKLLEIIMNSGYSRIPVYSDSFDNVQGILYIKDLLPHLEKPEQINWPDLLRPAFFVPENKRIKDLLQEFRTKKIHLAIVVDEYGGTSGIVTFEDVIEEIVGEINDEFDVESEEINFSRIDDSNYVFEGKTSLNDFCKIVGVDDEIFTKVRGEADTLAGLLLELTGKIPAKDESIQCQQFMFKIDAVDRRRIKRIKVTINPTKDEVQK
jgi:putative hemolysin